MALIIESTSNNLICVRGTAIELATVYARLDINCHANGKDMEIAFYTYADHNEYVADNMLLTDLPASNLKCEIDPVTQTQGLVSAHELAKTWFESFGYIVSIDLV